MSTLYLRSSNPGTRKQNICKNVDFNWLQNKSSTSLRMGLRQAIMGIVSLVRCERDSRDFKARTSMRAPRTLSTNNMACYCSDFSIIPRRSEWKLRVIILRTNLVWIFREKFENSSSVARILNMTSYSIIPRRCQDENGKEIYQNVNRTYRACRAIVFAT